jgi:hypothetical protein
MKVERVLFVFDAKPRVGVAPGPFIRPPVEVQSASLGEVTVTVEGETYSGTEIMEIVKALGEELAGA